MAEETNEEVEEGSAEEAEEAAEGAEEEEEKKPTGPKIMCFVSKQMVPQSETVEVEYAPRKKVRVLPKYIRYDKEEAAEA